MTLASPAAARPGLQGVSPGPLSKAHSKLEGSANCQKCHEPDRKVTATLCLSCHTPIADRIKAKKGVHRDVSDECAGCHVEHQGVDADTRPLDPEGFDHATDAGFALDGRHAKVAKDCARCHRTRSYLTNSQSCNSCHVDAHNASLGADCRRCHSTSVPFKDVTSRAFHKAGVFPLEGRHLVVACAACHIGGVFKGTPTRCYDCHWVRRQDDRYATRLGTDCGSCHRPVSWTAVNWNHGTFTGLPLSPVHRALGCDGCHKNQTFRRGDVTCFSCHQEDYQRTKEPNHAAAGFPTDCLACHRASHTSWSQTTFSHGNYFPLVGSHATQPCAACHKSGVYKGTPRDCVGCHRTTYDRTTSPPHAAAGFPTTCESCHKATDRSWTGASFSHNAFFALVGPHATQSCASCHKNNIYRGTPRDCVGCHRANYDRTTSPNHAAAGFSTACESCHRASDSTWRTTFNHASIFPLVGRHTTAPCASCHVNNVYKGTPRDCVGCHRANYDRTTSPNHAAAGFPTACESCHRASDLTWRTTFNHASVFQLLGRHAAAACASCHVNNVYKGTPRDCFSCHRATYDRTTNPNHPAAGFPTTCESCHSASASNWTASFDHNRFFPLLGRHATAACSSCHRNNVYKGTARDCYPCHQAKYDATTSPNHRAASFPTTCETCHRSSDTSWNQGRFNHTWFPITSGRHAGRACADCHPNSTNYKVFQCTTACHPQSSVNREHGGVPGYRYDSAACYSCHPTGQG